MWFFTQSPGISSRCDQFFVGITLVKDQGTFRSAIFLRENSASHENCMRVTESEKLPLRAALRIDPESGQV